jgi:Ca2+-binding EF-hand superfamily protein
MTEKDTVQFTKELEAFRKYDKNRSGAIEIDELKVLMADLGLLNGKSAAQIRECVVATFALADADRDNALNMEEFAGYYRRVTAPSLVEALQAEYPDDLSGVQHAFNEWVCFGARGRVKQTDAYLLGNAQWLKLCRDTGLVAALNFPSNPNPANKSQASPPPISQQEADLIYAKVRPKGKQRIEFPQFLDALGLIASKQDRDVIDVIRQITLTSGPVVNGTLVNVPRFESNAVNQNGHNTVGGFSDRQSTSSCVHKPKEREKEKQKANGKSRLSSEGFTIRAHRSTDEEETGGKNSSPILHRLHRVFKEFSEFGMGRENSSSSSSSPAATSTAAVSPASPVLEMDSKQFVKLCKECGLSKSPSHMAAVDLAYAKAKSTRSSRRLNFSQFLKALSLLAQDRGIEEDEIKEIVAGCQGPRRNSTTPDYCRLHDDKSTYTGVYAKGGPQTVDKSSPDLARLLDRSIAPA